MGDLPVSTLALLLVSAVLLSAFFSGTETALMSVNRYRLRHLAREGSKSARIAEKLLERPDRLIGMILICNNFVNSAAAAIVTLIALRMGIAALMLLPSTPAVVSRASVVVPAAVVPMTLVRFVALTTTRSAVTVESCSEAAARLAELPPAPVARVAVATSP